MRTAFASPVPCIKRLSGLCEATNRSGRAGRVRDGMQLAGRQRQAATVRMAESTPSDSVDDAADIDGMRSRLEGLFGVADSNTLRDSDAPFDGTALRTAIFDRWGVQYDVQPQKRHGRVYIQIMWRYFEQQSFYMDEEEFSSHCEAVAILLNRWKSVDYFLDYITNVKKRPVVGLTVNIPIPGLNADETPFHI